MSIRWEERQWRSVHPRYFPAPWSALASMELLRDTTIVTVQFTFIEADPLITWALDAITSVRVLVTTIDAVTAIIINDESRESSRYRLSCRRERHPTTGHVQKKSSTLSHIIFPEYSETTAMRRDHVTVPDV